MDWIIILFIYGLYYGIIGFIVLWYYGIIGFIVLWYYSRMNILWVLCGLFNYCIMVFIVLLDYIVVGCIIC